MSYKTGFYEGRLGIGLGSTMGMGDGNPRYPLDINGDIRLTGSIVNGDGQVLSLTPAAMNWTIDDDDIFFTASGNVGIGTDDPKTKLQIGGQENYPSYISNSEDALCVMHSTATSSTVLNDPQPCLILGRPGTSGQTQSSAAIFNIHRYQNDSVNARTQLSISLLHGGNATTDNVLVCRSNGYVGIGTTSPDYKLDIAGGWVRIGSGYDLVWGNSNCKIGGVENGDLKLSTNQIARLTVKQDGNVGIGTTSPDCKLDVNGQIRGGYNSDTLSYFGRTWVGVVGGLTDHAGIGHIDHIGNGEYALMQASSGKTYLGSVSGQSIGFRIGNSDKMELNSSGQLKVGYNTNTYCYFGRAFIGYNGHNDNAGFGHLDMASTVNYGFAQNSSGQTYVNCKSGTGIRFRISNSDKMCMDSNGNFGIGTTGPDSLFHIYTNENRGSTNTTNKTMLTIESATTQDCNINNFNPISIDFVMGDNNAPKGVARIGSLMCPSGPNNDVYGEASTALTFSTQNTASGSVPEERMRIIQNGNVGIGTTDPGIHRLRVMGTTGNPMYGQVLKVSCNEACWLELEANAGGSVEQWGINCSSGAGDLHFYKRFGTGSAGYKMTLKGNGNLGIGTTSPGEKLCVNGSIMIKGSSNTTTTNDSKLIFTRDLADTDESEMIARIYTGNYTGPLILESSRGGGYVKTISNWGGSNPIFIVGHADGNERLRITGDGRVGIGTSSPGGGLHVANYYDHGTNQVGNYFLNQNNYAHASSSWMHSSNSNGRIYVGIRCNYGIWCSQLNYDSDSRIKIDITDLSDNHALELVRNIPCREYHYKDITLREKDKTIGFIAQEVNKILPNAVIKRQNIIPNEMRKLENISWEEITDNSSNQYKLTTDLSDCSGIKYRFYVSNDVSGNDELRKEVIGNSDNSFTFDTSYNNVFCYGKEVDDFHTLDKAKLFALNFSATQELDKQQQADKTKIAELENEVATLKSELAAIKQHLGI